MIRYIKNLIIVLIFIFSLLFLYLKNFELDFQSKIFLLFSYSLIFSSIVYFYYNIQNSKSIPIFALTNIYFLFCYISLFFFDKYFIFSYFNLEDYQFAIKIFFLGYISFFIGYLMVMIPLKNFQRAEYKYFNLKNDEIFIIGILFLSLNILFYYIFKIQYIFPYLSQIKYPTLTLGIGLLSLYLATNVNKFISLKNILCIFLIGVPLFLEIISGSYSFPFLNIFLIFVFFSYLKKKLFILPLMITSILFIFFHIGKYEYRKVSWADSFDQENNKKIIVFFDVYKKIITDGIDLLKTRNVCRSVGSGSDEYCRNIVDIRLEKRVFHSFESLLIVTKLTKEYPTNVKKEGPFTQEVEFWNGYSYRILSSKIVPRILWRNKPSDTLGNEFGHRYNLLTKYDPIRNHKLDSSTSWNMPVLNEFYVNFGLKGTILGMLIIGILFGILTKFSSFKNIRNIEAIILFFLIVPLFFLESHLSLLIGAVLQSYIFLIIISYILLFILRRLFLVIK